MARHIGPAATKLIKDFEGLRLNAYPDPATGGDPWTIGYGHTGPDVKRGLSWSQLEADQAFTRDIARFEAAVDALTFDVPTDSAQFGALVSFAYNLWVGNLKSSTLLKLHRTGDFKGAKAQFALWNKAAGKVMAGLTRRRAAEAALYGMYM
jgi:lysozyme